MRFSYLPHVRHNSPSMGLGEPFRKAAAIAIGFFFGFQSTFAFGFSQEEITTAALNTFTAEAAAYDWNTYFKQYFNGVPDDPNTPVNEFIQQYDAGPLFGWGQSYLAMAQRAMFDATDDTQYLDLLLDGAETMYDNRSDRLTPHLLDIVRNNTLRPAFITFRYNPGTQHAWLVHSAFASHPVTYAISTINSDPQLQSAYGPGAVETYGQRAAALTADIIQTMDSFDADFDPNGGGCIGCGEYYEPYLDINSPHTNGQSPYNMQSAAGSTYVGLWNATGEQRFYDRAVSLANTLKEEFTLVGDRYEWRYAPYNPSGSAGDISHAGLDVNFVVDAYEAGIVFDDTDIERLANTFRHMRDERAAQGGNGFMGLVDGSDPHTHTTAEYAHTNVAWLWLRLTRYDAVLREQMYPVFQGYWDTTADNPIFTLLGSALLYETGQYITLPGDFNGNGTVDAADYTVWRDTLGASLTPWSGADATGDGLVTLDDYQPWRDTFGMSASVGGTGASVPEPAAASLLTGMLVALLAVQWEKLHAEFPFLLSQHACKSAEWKSCMTSCVHANELSAYIFRPSRYPRHLV